MSILSAFYSHYSDVPRHLESGAKNPHPEWKITLTRNEQEPTLREYMEEVATGDFYRVTPTANLVGIAGGIFLYGHLWGILTMACNAFCIALDIIGISIEAFEGLRREWKEKPKIEAARHFGSRVVVEIPTAVLHDLWGIVRAPFFTLAMMAAAVYGLFDPLGARIWYTKIEFHWHDRKGYEFDIRHHWNGEFNIKSLWQSYREGKILFMTYCCLKCGNRNDSKFLKLKMD
ncbi:MAG TPA: hypothetical protein VLG76_03650 [Rhabdochlamydiaceae bacterium]|nr:hypothetical protein [Rhabdochlamydiaceae bacterium]